VHLGPVVRNADGSLQRFGATPPKGATLRVRRYRTGGGSIGNVAPNTITVLQSPIPLVASVTNLLPALGGVDGESVEEAKVRGPLMLRTRNRAVTVEDFEFLARQAAPEIARIKCSVDSTGADAGAVRVLIVPDAPLYEQRIEFRDLVPDAETGRRIEQFLEERRVIGTRVRIEPPSYLGIKVEAQVRARPTADPARVTQDALRALYRYFNPLVGGPDGTGWPFGRPVQLGEVYGILQSVRGLDFVEAAVVMRTNPITGETFDPQDRIDLAPTNLVFSYEHAVEVL
jgi:predicted phage baseplate assembly protein